MNKPEIIFSEIATLQGVELTPVGKPGKDIYSEPGINKGDFIVIRHFSGSVLKGNAYKWNGEPLQKIIETDKSHGFFYDSIELQVVGSKDNFLIEEISEFI